MLLFCFVENIQCKDACFVMLCLFETINVFNRDKPASPLCDKHKTIRCECA